MGASNESKLDGAETLFGTGTDLSKMSEEFQSIELLNLVV